MKFDPEMAEQVKQAASAIIDDLNAGRELRRKLGALLISLDVSDRIVCTNLVAVAAGVAQLNGIDNAAFRGFVAVVHAVVQEKAESEAKANAAKG